MIHHFTQNINLSSAIENTMKFIVCSDLNNEVTTDGGVVGVISQTGGEKVTAKNDGGFAIEYHNGKKWTIIQSGRMLCPSKFKPPPPPPREYFH